MVIKSEVSLLRYGLSESGFEFSKTFLMGVSKVNKIRNIKAEEIHFQQVYDISIGINP